MLCLNSNSFINERNSSTFLFRLLILKCEIKSLFESLEDKEIIFLLRVMIRRQIFGLIRR